MSQGSSNPVTSLIMKAKHRPHDEAMAELFRDDRKFAAQYLDDILREGDAADLLVALRQMAGSLGGVSSVAEQAKLNPTQLYRTLSKRGNPGYKSLSAVLKVMGMRLSISPIAAASKRRVNQR